MKKVTIEIPDDVHDAITDEAEREFRSVPQQASYLLLTWSREMQEKRQKGEKTSRPAPPTRLKDAVHGLALDGESH